MALRDEVLRIIGESESLQLLGEPRVRPRKEARYFGRDLALAPRVAAFVRERHPGGLWEHQGRAIEALLAGKDVLVSTATSSGKSLVFALPIASARISEPRATALVIYPTKALANDQHESFRRIFTGSGIPHQEPGNWVEKYDGSTPQGYRQAIRDHASVVLTNPDMLHVGILNNHHLWARFFAGLRFVVLDEIHEYRGVFGTNVSYLMRRLAAVCGAYGSRPQFVCASATALNAAAHANRLTNRDFTWIADDADGSPSGERSYFMCRPKPGIGYIDAAGWLLTNLVDHGLGTIAFCPSRKSAERRFAALLRHRERTAKLVEVYRAGLLDANRQRIERQLKDGTLRGVLCTNALELGIDIGTLDVSILAGLPPTMMSLWQRAGRVGRAGKDGAIVIVAADDLIDHYYSEHAEELYSRESEPLYIHPENRDLAVGHYACIKKELGDRFAPEVVGPELSELRQLDAAGNLSDSLLYTDAPHAELSVRSGRDANYELLFRGEKEGDIDRSHLLTEAHTGAVYYHGGKRYKVKAVIEGEKRVILDDARDARDTRPSRTVYITRRQPKEVHTFGDSLFRLVYGEAVVRQETRGYYEIDDAGGVTGELHPIPPLTRSFPTLCTWLEIDEQGLARTTSGEIAIDSFPAAHALEHLIQTFVPIHARCDPFDLASDTRRSEGSMVVFLYDNVYGGIGLCRGLVEHTRPVLQQALDAIVRCRCAADEGCPNCIQSKRCFDRMGRLSKSGCEGLLRLLLAAIDTGQCRSQVFTEPTSADPIPTREPEPTAADGPELVAVLYAAGTRIRHGIFGPGTVVEATRPRTMLIKFDSDGRTIPIAAGPYLTPLDSGRTAAMRTCGFCGSAVPLSASLCAMCGAVLA